MYKKLSLYVASIVELKSVNQNLEIMHNNSLDLESKLFQLAYYDELTGLPSKILLEERVNAFLKGNPEKMLAFVYVDIDEFRNINEVKGHQIGDELIKSVAKVMSEHLKDKDMLCHTGGDEFVIAFFDIKDLSSF